MGLAYLPMLKGLEQASSMATTPHQQQPPIFNNGGLYSIQGNHRRLSDPMAT
jgi:hypothetical protein